MSCILLDDRLGRALGHGPEAMRREVEEIKTETWRDLADYTFLTKDRQKFVRETFSCVLHGPRKDHLFNDFALALPVAAGLVALLPI